MNDVAVICEAKDLPEYIEVDMGTMELGDILHLSDLQLPQGVVLEAFSHGDVEEHDAPVVSIQVPRGGEEAAEDEGEEEGETPEE